MEPLAGTYALILRNHSKTTTNVGRWGWISLEEGYYIYIGSAFGPGGVRARVSRHLRKKKRKHWHIDYLRDLMNPVGVWYTHDRQHLEHRWARLLSDMSCISSTHGFGCSDCKCDSHLFYAFMKSALALVPGVFGGEVETLYYRETA
jgi:Uri superfamily endonuclease